MFLAFLADSIFSNRSLSSVHPPTHPPIHPHFQHSSIYLTYHVFIHPATIYPSTITLLHLSAILSLAIHHHQSIDHPITYPSIHPCFYPLIHPSTLPSVHPYTHLFVHLSTIYPSTIPFNHPSILSPTTHHQSIGHPITYPSIHPCIHPYTHTLIHSCSHQGHSLYQAYVGG